VAVQVEEFDEGRRPYLVRIRAVIFVERDSQKGILIGKQGSMLKAIGAEARGEIEALLGAKVFLDLWVKVWKNWRKDPRALRALGYRG
jgi:GTP-binding protein Era